MVELVKEDFCRLSMEFFGSVVGSDLHRGDLIVLKSWDCGDIAVLGGSLDGLVPAGEISMLVKGDGRVLSDRNSG